MSHLLSSILGASSSLSWSSSSNCPSKASKDGMTSSDMLGLSLTYYANVLANSASAERCLFHRAHEFCSPILDSRDVLKLRPNYIWMECAECVEPLSLPCYLTCLSYETSTLRMTMLHCEPNIEEPLAHFRIQLSQVSKISKQKLKSTTKVSIVLSSLSLSLLFLVMKTSNDVP